MRLFKVNLSKYQIMKIADISSDIGVVCLASLVFPAIFGDFGSGLVLLGASLSLIFLVLSIVIKK